MKRLAPGVGDCETIHGPGLGRGALWIQYCGLTKIIAWKAGSRNKTGRNYREVIWKVFDLILHAGDMTGGMDKNIILLKSLQTKE